MINSECIMKINFSTGHEFGNNISLLANGLPLAASSRSREDRFINAVLKSCCFQTPWFSLDNASSDHENIWVKCVP